MKKKSAKNIPALGELIQANAGRVSTDKPEDVWDRLRKIVRENGLIQTELSFEQKQEIQQKCADAQRLLLQKRSELSARKSTPSVTAGDTRSDEEKDQAGAGQPSKRPGT